MPLSLPRSAAPFWIPALRRPLAHSPVARAHGDRRAGELQDQALRPRILLAGERNLVACLIWRPQCRLPAQPGHGEDGLCGSWSGAIQVLGEKVPGQS